MQLSNTEPTQNYMASAVLVANANDIPQEVTDRIQQQMAEDAQLEEYRNSAPPPDHRTENGHGNNVVPDNELTIAARSGQTATVRRLLESSAADVNERCGEGGQFALMHAATLGHTTIVQALLEASASVDLLCDGGRTALMWAARNGHTSVVLALLQASASVDLQRHGSGCTALMYAAWYGDTTIVRALLQASANVDLQNHGSGYTALMAAAWHGHTAIVQALLQASASVDLQRTTGETALMLAAERGRTAIVRLLLAAGANITLRDIRGVSAETLASRRNHAAAVLLLRGQSLRTCRAFGQRALAAAAQVGQWADTWAWATFVGGVDGRGRAQPLTTRTTMSATSGDGTREGTELPAIVVGMPLDVSAIAVLTERGLFAHAEVAMLEGRVVGTGPFSSALPTRPPSTEWLRV